MNTRRTPRRLSASALAAFLIVSSSSVARAADCTSAAALRLGEPAPCDGILTPAPWTARCLTCLRVDLPACRSEVVRAAAVARADLEACRAGRRAAEGLAEERLRLLREATAGVEPPSVWRSPWLWGSVGLAAGLVGGWAATR